MIKTFTLDSDNAKHIGTAKIVSPASSIGNNVEKGITQKRKER